AALAARPLVLVFLPVFIADGDAVEAYRAADVEAIANVPGVVAFLAVDRHPRRTEHLDLFGFVEHVLLERLAIDVAPLQHLFHEGVELVGGGWRRFGWRRFGWWLAGGCGKCQGNRAEERAPDGGA